MIQHNNQTNLIIKRIVKCFKIARLKSLAISLKRCVFLVEATTSKNHISIDITAFYIIKFVLEIWLGNFLSNYNFQTSLHLTYSSCYIVYIFFFLFSLIKVEYFTILIDGCLNIMVSHQSLKNRKSNTCFNTSCCKCMS